MLRVGEAPLADVDGGFVRVDPYLLTGVGVRAGEVIAIAGERRTVAVAQPLPPHLYGVRQILMDGMVRENARAVVGERVKVGPTEARPARTVLVEPLDAGVFGPNEVNELRQWLTGRALVYGDRFKCTAFSKRGHLFQVAGTDPETPVVVGPGTDIRIKKEPSTAIIQATPSFTVKYEDIGGLEEELLRVRELVELPLKYPELFARLRIEAPKGVLLYGPPGSGKTLIARAVASEVKAHFIHVNGPEIIHKFYGESEAKLREIFEEAQRRAPSVVFLDEIDAIAPRRQDVSGEVEKRVVAQLLALMDGLVSRGEVVVIGATNIPESVDPALRRPGRFDREIAINVPSRIGRRRILEIHSRGMPLADDVDLDGLAEVTHGFVGADLEALCKEAGMLAVRDCLTTLDTDAEIVGDAEWLAEHTLIRGHHFQEALKAIEPTATREFFLDRPNVSWEETGGLEEIRRTLLSALDLPRRHPALFVQAGIKPPTGFVFAGPSGTGKSLTVKALATETGLRLITVDAASLLSKWVGESEKALRIVFRKAKQSAPCILFFDGLDGLIPVRHAGPETEGSFTDRLARQFFAELDEAAELGEVVVIGATDRPDLVDPAALRAGRLGFIVHFVLPDAAQRERIFAAHLRRVRLADDVELPQLAARTDGFSGADIAGVCQRAALTEIERLVGRSRDDAGDQAHGGLVVSAKALEEAINAAVTGPTTPTLGGSS